MKLIQQLLEVAKAKNVRVRAKKRAVKKKAKTPTADKTRNLAALGDQTTGAGAHGTESTKQKKGCAGSRNAKKECKNKMEN